MGKFQFHIKISIQYINKDMNTPLLQASAVYRIGVVSKLSGIPVPTLRVWQTRYGAFTPTTTQGQHRLYSEEDLRKAALLKSLTAQGHGISRIAGLPTLQLQQLLQTGSGIATAQANTATHSQNAVDQAQLSGSRAWVVVGQGLAKRLQSPKTEQGGAWASLPIQQVWADVAEANASVSAKSLAQAPDVLVVSVNGLNEDTAQQIQALATLLAVRLTLVLYSFGQTQAMTRLTRMGYQVHREPLTDLALSQILQSTRPPLNALSWSTENPKQAIPARQYSEAVLQRVANIQSQVLCECPRHVAELIGQLGRFEDYSHDCLDQSPKDAELHQQLKHMAASARYLFEQALQMVATHEGISLEE